MKPSQQAALEALALSALCAALLQTTFDGSYFTTFAARDLDRALLLASGRPTLYGPEMSGGGHLPGPFFYALLALPLKLGLGWRGAWRLQTALAALGAGAAWLVLRLRLGLAPALAGAAGILTAAPFFDNLRRFCNASFLPAFAVLAALALGEAFGGPPRRRGLAWALAWLFLGLAVQLHLTALFVVFAAASLQLAARPLGLEPLRRREAWTGPALFALALSPYLAWLAARKLGWTLGQPALAYTGESRNILAWQLSVNREALLSPLRESLPSLLRALPAGALGAAACALLARGAGPRRPRETALLAAAAASAVPALAGADSRYKVFFIVCASLWSAAALARHERGPRRGLALFLFAAAFAAAEARHLVSGEFSSLLGSAGPLAAAAAAGAALAALVRLSPERPRPAALAAAALLPALIALRCGAPPLELRGLRVATFAQFEAMARDIRGRTSWSYAEARHRLFYVSHSRSVTPAWIYRELEDEPAPAAAAPPDGFFVGQARRGEEPRGAAEAVKWLLDRPLEPTLARGLRSGGIVVGEPRSHDGLVVAPYRVVDRDAYPPAFYDFSEGYRLDGPPGPPPLAGRGARAYRAAFNDSPGRRPVYELAAEARVAPAGAGRWDVAVTLTGVPISQSDFNVSPGWSQLLREPFLSWECEGRRRTRALAGAVGLPESNRMLEGAAFLAPYTRVFAVRCPRAPARLAAGYESALGLGAGTSRTLPRREEPLAESSGS